MVTKPLLILVALIAFAVPIAASLGWLGLILQYLESPMPLHRALGDMVWQTGTDFLLVAIPMFVLLGEILLRAGITERMYDGIVKWLGWLPGGLMHSNIGSSALFAATSGSSVATAATIGTVALPQIEKRGYNEPLFLGTVAAGGTLGILIPPSINLILYGLLTDTSVPELYLAGFLPGFMLALLFMATIVVMCLFRPNGVASPCVQTGPTGFTPCRHSFRQSAYSWWWSARSMPGSRPRPRPPRSASSRPCFSQRSIAS